MNIKHRKKWRRAPWDPNIMIPYMSYYLCESYRDVSGKACKRTVLNIGVMSTQVRASVSMKACRKVEVTTRKDSDPEEKLMEIYNALDTTPNPRGTLISVKSVGPKIHLQKNQY